MTKPNHSDIKQGTEKYEEKEKGKQHVPHKPAEDPGNTGRTREESRKPEENRDLPKNK